MERARAALEAHAKQARTSPTAPSYVTRNPDVVRAILRPHLRQRFGDFYAAAGLSEAQIATFETVAAGYYPLVETLLEGRRRGDTAMETAGLEEGLVEGVRARLGEAAAAHFSQTLRVLELRQGVDLLVTTTFATETPLTATQAGQLMRVLSDAARDAPSDRPLRLTDVDWDAAAARASALLSPAQLRAWDAIRRKAIFDREYERVTGFAAPTVLPSLER